MWLMRYIGARTSRHIFLARNANSFVSLTVRVGRFLRSISLRRALRAASYFFDASVARYKTARCTLGSSFLIADCQSFLRVVSSCL